jgi:hypothetical protein
MAMMRLRNLAVVSIVVATGLGLAACGTKAAPAPAATTTAPALSPAEQLTAALGKLKGQSYDVTISSSRGNEKVSVDAARHSATAALMFDAGGQSFSSTVTQVGQDQWIKIDLGSSLNAKGGINPTKWMLLDPKKLTGGSAHLFDLDGPDAMDTSGLFTKVSGVTAIDATHLSGTVDISAATGVSKLGKDALQAVGQKATAVPFTLTLDSEGRPAKIEFKGDVDQLIQTLTWSNYGSPTPITAPPAADVIPTNSLVYDVLNAQ